MTIHTIRLVNDAWSYDDTAPLGPPGGFGEVFRGSGRCGEVAVKRLKITASTAAHRELSVGERLRGRDLTHVVPVLDAGKDAESDRYFLVMPICERSLQQHLDAHGPFDYGEIRTIALEIGAGLAEVPDLVHRDLKPGNVLQRESRWQIADFGIAKFVEESTSLQTLRDILTPGYAAPEQWRNETPTPATDVYALGCIIHALASGAPPFQGSVDEIQAGHLGAVPVLPGSLPPRIGGLVATMLRKPSASRPSLERCCTVLRATTPELPSSKARSVLIEAGKALALAKATEEAEAAQRTAWLEEQARISADAIAEFEGISGRLLAEIASHSELSRGGQHYLSWGCATLRFEAATALDPGRSIEGGLLDWPIAAGATLSLRQRSETNFRVPSVEWNAVFLFADQGEGFRWYETAFFRPTDFGGGLEHLAPDRAERELRRALAGHDRALTMAYGPFAIDGEDEEVFIGRWSHLAATAALGELPRLDSAPIPLRLFGL